MAKHIWALFFAGICLTTFSCSSWSDEASHQTCELLSEPRPYVARHGSIIQAKGSIGRPLWNAIIHSNTFEVLKLDSLGGMVQIARSIPKKFKKVILTGRVASAAAMMVTENDNVCIDDTTVTAIRFHAIHDVTCIDAFTRQETVDVYGTNLYVQTVREPLRSRIKDLAIRINIPIPVEEFFRSYPDRRCY